ncbi:MAG: protein tyrosine phosphatase family protein [Shewanella sp.]
MRKTALSGLILALLLGSSLANAANVATEFESLGNIKDVRALQQQAPQLLTSGLPSEQQFAQLKQAGVDVVINLMPNSSKDAHLDERKLVTQAGMDYVYIPVDWQNPKVEEVEAFFTAMDQHKGKNVLVHCLANYRASAFAYLYQLKQGQKPEIEKTMAPWNGELPKYPQWQALLTDVSQKYGF